MKNILNKKAIKNALYMVLGIVKKALTQNRCDSCGFTKDEVYTTILFTESGYRECMKCYNDRTNS
jgi:hypothetical protein|tara:strand:- start:353 stop:547 length:195 start_codon:yes stop_codon:yes gene_type:complete